MNRTARSSSSRLGLRLHGLGVLVGLAALCAPPAGADEGGLPKPDPQAAPRQTVIWSAPPLWKALPLRPGEFAAWRLARAESSSEAPPQAAPGSQPPKVLEGPRAAIYYLGPLDERRSLSGRRQAWARRFVDEAQARFAPEAVKVTTLREPSPGAAPTSAPELEVSLLQVAGDYAAPLSPGEEAGPPRKGWGGLFGHVVGPDGVWVLEVVGPVAEIAPWTGLVRRFLAAAKAGEALRSPDPREAPKSPGDASREDKKTEGEADPGADEDDEPDDGERRRGESPRPTPAGGER